MTRKRIFIIAICLFTVLFIFRIIQQNKQRLTALPKINIHAVYDEPKFDLSTTESAKVQEITDSLPETLVATDAAKLIQTFNSGEVMSLLIPKQSEASASALKKDGKPTGIQLVTDDYYANIFHFLKLDKSPELCSSLTKENAHANVFVKSRAAIKTKATTSTVWELTSTKGTTLVQINGCYVDGKNAAWIVDFYFDSKKFAAYQKMVPAIFNSFSFK
jgi:hypothetical protein